MGSKDVLQLLLLRLQGDHLLLQAPILQLPVVDLQSPPGECLSDQVLLHLPLVCPAKPGGVICVDFVLDHAGHTLQLGQDDVTIAPVRSDHGGGAEASQSVRYSELCSSSL